MRASHALARAPHVHCTLLDCSVACRGHNHTALRLAVMRVRCMLCKYRASASDVHSHVTRHVHDVITHFSRKFFVILFYGILFYVILFYRMRYVILLYM